VESNSAGGIRARVRAEMLGEIKKVARRQLATDGANLSLRAVARELGMVSSGLYRYFASRDDLLTALILDAYNDLGAAAEEADAAIADRADGPARWLAATRALRGWALANPAEYALLYGTPVPGYQAPPDTTAAAQRPPRLLGRIVAETGRDDHRPPGFSPALATEIGRIRDQISPQLGAAAMLRGMIAWTLVFGALSFEVFGRYNQTIAERDEFYDRQMLAMVEYLGLR
jgi:AcrR family transcriptional regulator